MHILMGINCCCQANGASHTGHQRSTSGLEMLIGADGAGRVLYYTRSTLCSYFPCLLFLPSSVLAQFGRTEVIDNTLNPDFVRKYILDYFFEEKQNLRFDVYDIDSKSPDLAKHDFLGQVFCTLGEIVGSPASRLEKQLV
ncbi:hypothetical protein ILYODFUR_018754, partial [Ilyodon furcidens]